jgi:hypothetical protein
MDRVTMQQEPLEDLHSLRNKKALVTLRGHRVHDYDGRDGIYLGYLRESFPGTDGLDRASSPVGEDWLRNCSEDVPEFILAEGATLATRRFLTALHETTDLLLVYLYADDFVKELRFLQRGSNQDPQFVLATATRSENLLRDMNKIGVRFLDIDSSDSARWEAGLSQAVSHINSRHR